VLASHGAKPAASLERHAFYAAAETAYAIVQTGAASTAISCSPRALLRRRNRHDRLQPLWLPRRRQREPKGRHRRLETRRPRFARAQQSCLTLLTLAGDADLASKTSLCDYSVMLHRKPPSGDSVRSICGMFCPLGAHA
jgi:hypothetical protein